MSNKSARILTGKKYVEARKKAKRLLVPNHPERPEIVSNIPIPVQTRGGTRKFDCFYPFEDMKVGDSFWVPSDTQCTAGAASKFAKRTGWKLLTRGQSLDERANKSVADSLRGTRVWRVT